MNQDNNELEDSQPIAGLATLEQEVSPRFLGAVRQKIYRRTAANQMVAFSWNLPKVILMEMLMLVSHFLSSAREGKVKP